MKCKLYLAALLMVSAPVFAQDEKNGTGEMIAPYSDKDELKALGLKPSANPGQVNFINNSYDWVYLRIKEGAGAANISIRRNSNDPENTYGASAICMCWQANTPIYYCPSDITVWAPAGYDWVFGVSRGTFCRQGF